MSDQFQFSHQRYQTYYEVVGVSAQADFKTLKKAYYQRAKACHPDTAAPGVDGEAEFKLLVRAFDILSDPQKRNAYDAHLMALAAQQVGTAPSGDTSFRYEAAAGSSIMDTAADDYLEEVVVGNYLPKDATLQTLLRDLERTKKFMLYREGKTAYFNGDNRTAMGIFQECVKLSSGNILYHFYLAATYQRLRLYKLADQHLAICTRLGKQRNPPQMLRGIRDKLYLMREKHRGFIGRMKNLLSTRPERLDYNAEDEMVGEMNRAMSRLLVEGAKRQRRLAQQERKLLDGGEPSGDES